MEKEKIYNPNKINVDALKIFLSSLINNSSGDFVINLDELDSICKIFKEMVKVYIAKPDAFEQSERPCNYNCNYIGQVIDFVSKGEKSFYYCRIQNNCPVVDESCICPYNTEEEKQYAENILKLQNNLSMFINQNTNLDGPKVE